MSTITRESKYSDFYRSLQQQPGEWVEFPGHWTTAHAWAERHRDFEYRSSKVGWDGSQTAEMRYVGPGVRPPVLQRGWVWCEEEQRPMRWPQQEGDCHRDLCGGPHNAIMVASGTPEQVATG